MPAAPTLLSAQASLARLVFPLIGTLAFLAICQCAEPVTLTPQPQKFRTFYSLDDPQIPAELKQPGATARAVASDGAVWYVTAHGVMRADPKAPPRDREVEAEKARARFVAGRR